MRGRPNAGVHADKGGVAAGRDIVAQLLITGDHNVVFAGGYQQLEDAFVDPSSVFERVHTERFTGREWLIDEIDQFLAERERGYLVVEARAGLGKTAFLTDLAGRAPGYVISSNSRPAKGGSTRRGETWPHKSSAPTSSARLTPETYSQSKPPTDPTT